MSELKVKDKANSTNTEVPITTECDFAEVDLVFTTKINLKDLNDLAFQDLCNFYFPLIEQKLNDYFNNIEVVYTNPSADVQVDHTCCITNDTNYSCEFITHVYFTCESYYDVYQISSKLCSTSVNIFRYLRKYFSTFFSSLDFIENLDTDIINDCYLNTIYHCSEYLSNLRNSPEQKD